MRSLTRDDLREAQKVAIPFLKETKKCALFAEMGLGKSGATITTLVDLFDEMAITRVLIVAPLRVAKKTWPDEFELWEDARWIKYRCLWNSPPGDWRGHKDGERRIRYWEAKLARLTAELDSEIEFALEWEFAFNEVSPKTLAEINRLKREISIAKRTLQWGYISARHPEEVHIVNRENLVFLVHFWGKFWPYDTVVFDESSGLRNGRKAKRWRALRKVMPIVDRFIELTGTPVPNGLLGLWAQIFLIDGGQRLGTSMEAYRKRFFYQEDYHGYKWALKPGAEESIYSLVSDVTLTLRSADYLDIPETIYNNIPVVLSDSEMKLYQKFEKEFVLELEDGLVTASNAAVLAQKLMQIANGVVYGETKEAYRIHDAKLEALDEYIDEQQGAPVLVAYWFKHDLALLQKRFPHFKVFADDDERLTDQWNSGNVPGMFLHPQSAGHGLNIQFGGRRILWYGPIHDLELYQQLNARLSGARAVGQGVAYIDHLIAYGTADEAIMESLRVKNGTQSRLLDALKRVVHSCL